MKKLVVLISVLLVVLLCFLLYQIFVPTEKLDFTYVQKNYAKYVLSEVDFDAISCVKQEGVFSYDPNFNKQYVDRIASCPIFDDEICLKDETVCRKYMELLWHGLGMVGCGHIVPSHITCYPEQNTVMFAFISYECIIHNGAVIGLLDFEILVDAQTGELIYAMYT